MPTENDYYLGHESKSTADYLKSVGATMTLGAVRLLSDAAAEARADAAWIAALER